MKGTSYSRRDLIGSLFGRRGPGRAPAPPRVARLDLPRRGLPRRLGTVRIDPAACLASPSMTCTVCVERCPLPGAIVRTNGAPRVDPQVCDGCGECVAVCPAPTLAIRVTPLPRSQRHDP